MPSNFSQVTVRIRSDKTVFNPGTPVWETTENQAAPLLWPEALTFRIRAVVQNTGSGGAGGSAGWNIAFSRNGGAFTLATTTGTIVKLDSTASSDAGSISLTTHVLSGGLGTAINGIATDDSNTTTAIAFANSTHTEFEFGLSIVKGGANDGDTLDFHVFRAGAALNSYAVTPRITVAVDDGFGSAQGDAIAAAAGQASIGAVGQASGDAIASAFANFNQPIAGTAQGDSTATAFGTGFSLGAGSAIGDSSASAIGSGFSPTPVMGVAIGDATASAESMAGVASVGNATGDSFAMAMAQGASFGQAIGDSIASARSGMIRQKRVWHLATKITTKRPQQRTEIY